MGLTLSKTNGDNQQSPEFSVTLSEPLVISVAPPSVGIPITFAITQTPHLATGASLSTISSTVTTTVVSTDSNGNASVQLTLGNEPGQYSVTATCPTFCPGQSVTFTEGTTCSSVLSNPLTGASALTIHSGPSEGSSESPQCGSCAMFATFAPLGNTRLADAAQICGVTNFRYKQ